MVLSIMPAPLVRSQITPTINQGTLDRAILSDPIPQPQSTTPVCRAVDTYYLRRTQAADDLLDQDEDRLQAQSLAVQRVDQEIADVERRIERAERERASGGSDPDLQSYINDLKERLAQLQQRRDQLNATRPERRTQRNRLNSIYVVVKNSQLAELNRRGVQAFDAGEFDRALRFFDAIIQQAEELGDPAAQLAAKANSATVYEAQADYATALTVLQAALASAGQTAPQAARIQLDVARVYDKLGSDNQAQAEYQAALRISEQQGRVADRAAALSSLGFLYNSQGNYQAALQHFAQAREALNTVRLDGRAILHEEHLILAGMGKAQMQLGNHSAAMESYTHALALSQNCNNLIVAAMALNGLGEVHQTLGQTNQSLDAYQQSLQTRRTVGDAAGEAETLANIGAWYVAQGQPTLGIVFYKQAVKRLEAIRTKIETLTLDQQSAYATSVTATYRELANLLLQQDRVLEAQQVLDLLKVQELHDFLKDVHQPIEGTRTGEQLTFLPEENTLLQIFDRTLAQGDLSNFENRSDVTSNVSELASRASLQKVNADLLRSLQDNIQRIAPDSAILYPVIFE
ncbi:MAG: tetratricopeptide repeat protein, partial [Cyanobacteria bacterium P01_A01_bin.17]